jgi:hypothetical protein
VLDAQTQDFASRARFVHAVLGLLSLTERVQALTAAPSSVQARPGSQTGGVADLLLGLVSIGHTLRATLELDLAATKPAPPRPAAPEPPGRLLR